MTDIFLYKELTRTRDIMNENFELCAGSIRSLSLGLIFAGIGFLATAKLADIQEKQINKLQKDLTKAELDIIRLRLDVDKLTRQQEKENTECDD